MLARLLSLAGSSARRLLVPPPTPACAAPSACGFKVKKLVKLRCEHCYFIRVNGRLHVECHKFPKHKQREEFNIKTLW